MFNKTISPAKPVLQPVDRSPRTVHTPGAYPSLSRPSSQDEQQSLKALAMTHDAATKHTSPATELASTPSSEATKDADARAENRLLVGPQVKLKGAEILDCDTLVVEGRVEATMDSRVIQIAEGGSFSGKVGIDIAEIRGSFEGELTARDRLVIHATGRVKGKIRYGTLLIESGGVISGEIESLADSNSGTSNNSERNLLLKSVMNKAAIG